MDKKNGRGPQLVIDSAKRSMAKIACTDAFGFVIDIR